MKKLLLFLALSSACITDEAADLLDGDIEDPGTCCAYFPWEEKIVRCIEPFLDPEDPDTCLQVRCITVEAVVCHGATEARIWEDHSDE